jgi:uncharacterized protein YxjI
MRYAMSSKWWPERFTISDDAGRARFEVRNVPGFAPRLSLRATGGEEIATIRRRSGRRFQVIARGKEAGLVRQRAADRCDIRSTLGPLAAVGNVADGHYAITGGDLVKAKGARKLVDHVRQAQRISVDINDEDDTAVLLLATMLAIEALLYERGGTHFNPRGGLDLFNPFNWI